MNVSKITNPEAKRFIDDFMGNREINREFYTLVPEESFDFRMVNTPERKSDSPRESLAHQIDVTYDYVNGVKTGVLKFGIPYENLRKPIRLSKNELLNLLTESEKELIAVLSDPGVGAKTVKVPWATEPIPAVSSLWGLSSHEVLHTGWNLAVMDHLNIPRFSSLKNMWG